MWDARGGGPPLAPMLLRVCEGAKARVETGAEGVLRPGRGHVLSLRLEHVLRPWLERGCGGAGDEHGRSAKAPKILGLLGGGISRDG